jgi:hypothetical protein
MDKRSGPLRRLGRRTRRRAARMLHMTGPAPPFPGWQTEPSAQITWGIGYIKGTYGRP